MPREAGAKKKPSDKLKKGSAHSLSVNRRGEAKGKFGSR